MEERLRWLCLVVFMGWFPWMGTALAKLPETPQFRYFGIPEGLPSSTVANLTQDAEGYIWMATHDGLARYDGMSFRVWRHVRGEPGSLPSNVVQVVHVDAQNRIWVGLSGGGLHMLDRDRQSFVHYTRETHPEIGSDEIYAIASTRDGSIWFGTDSAGLHRLDPKGKITRYTPQNSALPDAYIWTAKTDASGRLWVGTGHGLAYWTGSEFQVLNAPGLTGEWITALSPAKDGSLFIGVGAHLFRRGTDGRIEVPPWFKPIDNNPGIYGVLADNEGGYWMSTHRGLRRISWDQTESALPENLPISQVNSLDLLRDHEGGWWFATEDRGVAYLPPSWNQFSVLRPPPADASGAPRLGYLRDVAATPDGKALIVGERGLIEEVDVGNGSTRVLTLPPFTNETVYSAMQTAQGVRWFGSARGLTRIAPDGTWREWSQHSQADATLGSVVDQLMETPKGEVWASYMPPAVQMRDSEGRVRVSIRPDDGHGIDATYLESIRLGPDGQPWLSTAYGLLRWQPQTQKFEPVPGSPRDRIFGFAYQKVERIWLHRLDALEAYQWDGRELTLVEHIDGDEGLPPTESGGVIVGGGNVWLTTRRGLICWDTNAERLRIYGLRDGLPSQEFTEFPPTLTRSGVAIATLMQGAILFGADQRTQRSPAPRLVIETLSYRRDEDEIVLDPSKPVELGPEDRDLRVSTRLLSFVDSQVHRYRFMLHGYDPDWLIQPANGERVFSKLEPGSYRLEIQAANADGVWSASRVVQLTVRPPWWRTWPALAAAIGLVLLVAWAAAYAYRRRLQRRLSLESAQHEREIANQASLAKTRFLATLGHEVRTPMTGVLGMSELLLDTPLDSRQRGYIESIRGAGEHLLRLVNDALDLARIESGRLELADQAFDLRAVVDETSGLMAPLAQQRGLAFEVDVASDTPRGLRGDASRVRQILLNLLSNAIKFTEQGRVSLQVEALLPQGVRFVVTDTGPGLNEEQKTRLFRRFEQAEGARTAARYGGSGLGLAICQELAAAMDGHIQVDSEPGAGARFVFDLPLPIAPVPERSSAPVIDESRRVVTPLALLLVEDDPTVAEVIAGLLRAQGHRVTHVANGLAALSEAATASFDLALLDLDLPGINGLDLARQLRILGFAQPLVAVTARADTEAEPQALAAGFNRFLRKPVTGAMLGEIIDAVMGRGGVAADRAS